MMESVWRDIRQALRMMYEHKAFSAGVLLTLALGIGANTAMFSIVHGVLLRPLRYEGALLVVAPVSPTLTSGKLMLKPP